MIDLAAGPYEARVNPGGVGLAALSHDGADLIRPQDGAGGAPEFRGAVLAPWSNRIADGHYAFAGVEHQLPVTEPERNNALHGLVLDEKWEVRDASQATTTLTLELSASTGYPYRIALLLTYTLDETGLTVALTATNTGDSEAPYGCGFHPYVLAGNGTIDDVELAFTADRRLRTSSDRLLPLDQVDVVGTEYDFSAVQQVGARQLDDAFTGLGDDAGGHVVRVGDVRLRWGAALPWVHLFTPPERDSLAVEPCTGPPDAFRTGVDLVVLPPGESCAVSWSIGHVATWPHRDA